MDQILTIKKKDLEQALLHFKPMCSSVAGSKFGRFDTAKGNLYITSLTIAEELSVKIPVQGEVKTFALDMPMLISIFQNMPENFDTVVFNLGENQMRLTVNDIRYDLPLINPSVMAVSKKLPAEEKALVMTSEWLLDALRKVAPSIGQGTSQPWSEGLYFQRLASNSPFRIVTTSGLSLAYKEMQGDLYFDCCIDNKAANILRSLLKHDTTISVYQIEKSLVFKTGNAKYIARAIDSQYPSYQQVIQAQEGKFQFQVNRQALVTTLQRALVVDRALKFTVTQNELIVSVRKDGQAFKEKLSIRGTGVALMEIGMSGNLFLNHIHQHDCEELTIRYTSPENALAILGDPSSFMLVMPCRL